MTTLLERAWRRRRGSREVDQNAWPSGCLMNFMLKRDGKKRSPNRRTFLRKLADEALNDKRKGNTAPLDPDRLCIVDKPTLLGCHDDLP